MNRVQKLRELIDTGYGGRINKFAAAIKRSPGQVSQWLNGHRELGDAGARIIETALSLPQGYFDDRSGHRVESDRATYPVGVVGLPKKIDADIAAVVAMMESTDERGRGMALAAVKVALAGYKPAKANRRS